MAVTVLPAPDNTANMQGLLLLAQAIAEGRRDRRDDRNTQIAALEKLRAEAPKLPETEQNALLNIPPAQFKQRYGVDIDTVAPKNAAGMRVLVQYPEGTLAEQAAKQGIVTSKAQAAQAEAIAKSTLATSARADIELAKKFQDNYVVTNPDGTTRRPTLAESRAHAVGDPNAPELTAKTKFAQMIEELSPVIGGPEATRMVREGVFRDETMSKESVNKILAEIENTKALTELYKSQSEKMDAEVLAGGLGDSAIPGLKFGAETVENMQKLVTGALAQFAGVPAEAAIKDSALGAKLMAMIVGSFTPGLQVNAPTTTKGKTADAERLAGLFFGPEDLVDEYIASMRKDMGGKGKMTIKVPRITKDGDKNKLEFDTLDLDDPAVRQNLKYIRTRTAQLGPLIQDLRDVDPTNRRLAMLTKFNPLIARGVYTMYPELYEELKKVDIESAGAVKPVGTGDKNLDMLSVDQDAALKKRLLDLEVLLGKPQQ